LYLVQAGGSAILDAKELISHQIVDIVPGISKIIPNYFVYHSVQITILRSAPSGAVSFNGNVNTLSLKPTQEQIKILSVLYVQLTELDITVKDVPY
jgi:hypothetical protein